MLAINRDTEFDSSTHSANSLDSNPLRMITSSPSVDVRAQSSRPTFSNDVGQNLLLRPPEHLHRLSREQFDSIWRVLLTAYPELGLPGSWGDAKPLVSILGVGQEILCRYQVELDRDDYFVSALSRATDIVVAERAAALSIQTFAASVLLPIPIAGPVLAAVAALLAEPIAKWLTKDP